MCIGLSFFCNTKDIKLYSGNVFFSTLYVLYYVSPSNISFLVLHYIFMKKLCNLIIVRENTQYCVIEKLSFYSLSLEKKTKNCSRIFGEHLAAIFRGMCVGWRHSSCDHVGPHERRFRVMTGISMPWSLFKGGLPFVDLDGVLDLSPVVVLVVE